MRVFARPPERGDAHDGGEHRLGPNTPTVRSWCVSLVCVAVACAAPLLWILGAGHTLVWRDTVRLFGPLRGLVVEALRALHLPLWNPHEAFGLPLFAQMIHGVLHPVSIVAAFLAPGAGMDVFIVAYVVLAGLGTTVLAGALGASPAGAALAGVGFGLSGYVLSMSGILTYLAAAATAPWTVAALCFTSSRRSLWGLAVGGFSVASLHFAGDPQWTLLALLIGLALSLEQNGKSGSPWALSALVLGTSIAAVQLVPSWVYMRATERALGLDPTERMSWALAPVRALEFVAPGFFAGHLGAAPDAPVFKWLGGVVRQGYSLPFAASVFLGVALIVFAWNGMRSRTGALLGLAAGVSLWLALGYHAGADQLLHRVPIWGSFRYAEKMMGPVTLCLALLAGFGCDRLARVEDRRLRILASASAGLGVCALALARWPGVSAMVPSGAPPRAVLEAGNNLVPGLLHATAAAGALCLLAFGRRFPVVHRHFRLLAALIVFLESAAAAPFALHVGERGVVGSLPLRREQPEKPVRILTPSDQGVHFTRADLDHLDGIVDLFSRMGVASYNVHSRIDQLDGYSGVLPLQFRLFARLFSETLGPAQWVAHRRYAVTHVVLDQSADGSETQAEAALAGARLVSGDDQRGITVWEVPHRAWASFATRVVRAASQEQALITVAAAERSGDPAAVLETGTPFGSAAGTVARIERAPNRVRIEAEAAGDALLVVNDTFWPGWIARIDGSAVPLWRADGLVRAVPWPPGRHVLEMRYEPPEVRTGLRLTGLGLGGAVVLLIGGAVRRGGEAKGGRAARRSS
ncbi:MAG: hypothetical protein HY900_31600 [Deltaproteobacteria bacterium]|nr:hypothetical protein [Deltaproteobacteria bacterium]